MKPTEETPRLVFAAIADYDTGASDLAGMLAEQGVRTLLVIDLPDREQLLAWSRDCDAIVLAEGTRNLPADEARAKTRQALQLIAPLHPRTVAIKYCSTFDSTPVGNIGPTIDVAMEELGVTFTIALPALPINGRTTKDGLHYVNGQLLNESPLRHHPLNPMTNANLVEWLQQQTPQRVGLAALAHVEAGVDALRRCYRDLQQSGVAIAIVDCVTDGHLETICRASADLRLITGGSGFGMKLPALWRERGWLTREEIETSSIKPACPPTIIEANALELARLPATNEAGCLIVAGSCSEATRRQNAWFAAQGGKSFRLEPRDLLEANERLAALRAQLREELSAGRACLCFTSDAPEQVEAMQQWGAARGLSVATLGEKIATAMADFTHDLLQAQPVAGLIVAGGETASALCRRLQLGALRVGRNIEPGVPLCQALAGSKLPIVLKSGNFGGVDFYHRALKAVTRASEFLG